MKHTPCSQTLRSATFRRKVNSGGFALSLFASDLRPEHYGHGPDVAYSLPDKLSTTTVVLHFASSITFLLLLRVADSSWHGLAIAILLLLLAGAIALLLQRENAATPSSMVDDTPEHRRIKQELEKKSALLATVNHALTTFLDTGDWSAASRHLLSFALNETQSEFGLLGVVLEGPVLRVLAHKGIHCCQSGDHDPYESGLKQYEECGYFDLEHPKNLLGDIIQKAKTVVSINPLGPHHSQRVPAGHPLFRSFLGVPIFKGSEIVGVIGVANRPSGYTGEEVRSLETISQTVGVLYDDYRQSLTRQHLEEERTRLESEFRRAQKMEVLGQLAGGIAHDFNNMLIVLTGSEELLEASLPPKSKGRPYLEQFQRTTERAAAIRYSPHRRRHARASRTRACPPNPGPAAQYSCHLYVRIRGKRHGSRDSARSGFPAKTISFCNSRGTA